MVADISDAIAANIDSYIAYPGHTLAGSIAKAAWFADAAGDDPASFGGVDLIADLEAQVAGSDPVKGRIQDSFTPGPFESDFANVVGQAFAARALAEASSADAAEVIGFLLDQQCAEGFFRLYFNPDASASDQTCAGGAAGESTRTTDATALAVLQLTGIAAADPASSTRPRWLRSTTRSTLPRPGCSGRSTPTARSGAGRRPRRRTRTAPASPAGRSASSVTPPRPRRQPPGSAHTRPTSRPRARTRSPARPARSGTTTRRSPPGRTDGITTTTQDQWRRSTAPILPVLRWAPASTSQLGLTGPTGYLRAGTSATYQVSGAAPGAVLCVSGTGSPTRVVASGAGTASAPVAMPAATATALVTASVGAGSSASVRVDVLGATTLTVKPRRDVVHRRARLHVVVRGLAPAEQVTVRFRGRTVGTGVASPSGRLVDDFSVGRKLGRAKVKVRGESGRSGTARPSSAWCADAGGAATPARRDRRGGCRPGAGACHGGRLLRRFRRERGGRLRRARRGIRKDCDDSGNRNAAQAFENTGHHLSYAQRQPGFVCRVGGVPESDPCVNTSPADAYWGLYWSNGSSGWKYSTTAAGSLSVPAGGTVALSWQNGGAADPPGVAPASPAPAAPVMSPSASSKPTKQPARKKTGTASGTATRPPASPSPAIATTSPTVSAAPTSPGPSASASPLAPVATDSGPAVVAEPQAGPVTADPGEDSSGDGLAWWVPVGVLAALAGAGGAAWWRRRRTT